MSTNENDSSYQVDGKLLPDVLNALSAFFSSIKIVSTTNDMYQFEGDLRLNNPHCAYCFSRTVHVTIYIAPTRLKEQMPIVKVHERWMNKSVDWHCYEDGRLCWELKKRWEDKLVKIAYQKPPYRDFIVYAISWCIESSICLISRHWYAHINNIKTWPQEWKFWAHYTEGEKEYERGKRKNERKKFRKTHC